VLPPPAAAVVEQDITVRLVSPPEAGLVIIGFGHCNKMALKLNT
jgi:hypothetical protein